VSPYELVERHRHRVSVPDPERRRDHPPHDPRLDGEDPGAGKVTRQAPGEVATGAAAASEPDNVAGSEKKPSARA